MKKFIFTTLTLIFSFTIISQSQQLVKEPSTGKSFPAEVSFRVGDKDYSLSYTGLAVRKKFFFKVYGMIHYIDYTGEVKNKEEAFNLILTDGKAKQITMEFARDVDAQKIRDAYMEGFKLNATPVEFQSIQPLVNQFVDYFNTDVKENDKFILRWLPGGAILTIIKGNTKPVITSDIFARTLWSIWFGKGSIVDRDKLIERMLK